MNNHTSYSRPWTILAGVALLLGTALLLPAQDAKSKGIPKDWSMHHVVFSKPHNAAQQQKLANNPRYILQQQIRAAMAAPPSLPAPLAATERPDPPEVFPAYNGGPLPRGIHQALIPPTGKEAVPNGKGKKRFHKDWSVGIGSNGTTGVGQFPATYTQTASPCGSDIAIYNTGLGGSVSQATVVAYNNIYASCGTAPIGLLRLQYRHGARHHLGRSLRRWLTDRFHHRRIWIGRQPGRGPHSEFRQDQSLPRPRRPTSRPPTITAAPRLA